MYQQFEGSLDKVKVSLNRGTRTWAFVLYDSAESAYYLKDESTDDVVPEDEDFRRVITISSGETLEVEWVGAEWVYDDPTSDKVSRASQISIRADEKFDKVRIGKVIKRNGIDDHAEVYSGWLISSKVPLFRESQQGPLKITPVKGRIKSKFDFVQIFLDQGLDDSEPEYEGAERKPTSVN